MRASQLESVAHPPDDPWLPLLLKVGGGDEDALADLYDRSSPIVFGLVCRIVGDREVAEEVTIDVYSQLWRKASEFDAKRGRARSWLLLIARSRALDYLRSSAGKLRTREQPLEETQGLSTGASDPEASALDLGRRLLVRQGLENLGGKKRAVIELAFFGGLTHSEIAGRLGSPLGTVKARIRQAMRELRTFMEERGEAL